MRAPNVPRAAAALCAAAAICAPSVSNAQAVTQWSQFLGNGAHSSYAADANVSTSNASSMGVKWMANLFSPDLGSPVVAFNSALGKQVVYLGDERGDVYAIDASNGSIVWSTNLGFGDAVRATPAVASDGSVWVGTNFNPTMYKLNGATGAVLCSAKSPVGTAIMGSPAIATPAGGSESVFWDAIDNGTNGPVVATNVGTCSQTFQESILSGQWTTPAYGVDGSGEPLVLVGTADPGDTEWALDAVTGKTVWSYPTAMAGRGWDVGQAATISAPGVNGFADGVAYVASEYGDETALDLATGSKLWVHYIYPSGYNMKRYIISSAALDGNQMVFGYDSGVMSLNATTGAQLWNWNGPPGGIDSSPAIVGPSGSEVVAFGDLYGVFHLFALSSGSPLYSYQTGSYIVSSPAENNGTMYIASADGFLYAFAAAGGNGGKPQSSITSPASGTTLANPNGSVTLSGSASDAASVSGVEIAVQSGGASGAWYDAATNAWNSAPIRNQAALANAGSANTTWSFSLPVPAAGGTYRVYANAVNRSHLVEKGSVASFSVSPSKNEPTVRTSASFAAPGAAFHAYGGAFKPGETVTFTLFGTTVATATVGSTGGVPNTTIVVPSTAQFGPASLVLTGNTSQKSASATIDIINAWTQYGYGSARTAYEPNDEVISHTIFVGAPVLNLLWMYNSGAAVDTSPAVLNNVAYFGNDAGVLSAVNLPSGSPAWTFTVPSGAAIHSSPAVDHKNQIIFGADDGKLYVVNKAGSSVATVTLSGRLGAPAFADGTVIVGADNGEIYSLADPGFTTNWSINAGSAVTAPPAYDVKAKLVIAGTSTGAIVAYKSGTGAVAWSASTGGAVNALAIGKGTVYAGSADGHLYAYNETTGAQKWSVAGDGSAVTAVGVNNVNNPTFATAQGAMYDDDSNGNPIFQRKYTTASIAGIGGAGIDFFGAQSDGLVGMIRKTDGSWHYNASTTFGAAPIVFDGMMLVGGNDGNLYAFTPQGYTPPSSASVKLGSAVITVDGSGASCAPAQ